MTSNPDNLPEPRPQGEVAVAYRAVKAAYLRHRPSIAGVVGTAGFVLCGWGWPSIFWGQVFFVTCAISSVFLIAEEKIAQNRTQDELQRTREELDRVRSELESVSQELEQARGDYTDRLREYLKMMSAHLLGPFGNADRVSIYKHDGKAFVLLGRYSDNSDLELKNSGYYPDNVGLLSEVWGTGKIVKNVKHDPTADEPSRRSYCEYQIKQLGMNQEALDRMRMWSRSYAGFRLRHHHSDERLGIVMFESLAYQRFKQADVDAIFPEGESRRLAAWLHSNEHLEPSPALAAAEGI